MILHPYDLGLLSLSTPSCIQSLRNWHREGSLPFTYSCTESPHWLSITVRGNVRIGPPNGWWLLYSFAVNRIILSTRTKPSRVNSQTRETQKEGKVQKDVSYPQGCRSLNTAHVSYNAPQKTVPQPCPLKSIIILIKTFNVHFSIALRRLGFFVLFCLFKEGKGS